MTDPAAHLPPLLQATDLLAFIPSLGLPVPTSTEPLTVTAAFHQIYLIHFSPSATPSLAPARSNNDGSTTLVLRVAGRHVPRIKTENEIAMMKWVRENTAIPVPAVIRWDSSCENILGREFSLLERIPGSSADKIFWEMGDGKRRKIVAQLVGFLAQLREKSTWRHVGGLRVGDDGAVVPGPVVDEWFWMGPHLDRFWGGTGETVESLNPVSGPFETWAAHADASMGKYIHVIDRHPALVWMRDLAPRLEAFRAFVRSRVEELEDTEYVLAHRDLHLANVMVDGEGNVTGVLDWEFGGVVPGPRWDPPNAFLYPWGGEGDEAKRERDRMRGWAREICSSRGLGADVVDGVGYRGCQQGVHAVLNYTRAICELWREERGGERGWRISLEAGLAKFGL